MANKQSIIADIDAKVANTKYSVWRIGLAHDLAERKAYWRDTEKENVSRWSDWTADSRSDARDIEAHFIEKGMKGGTAGNLDAHKTVYVYMF